MQANIGTLPEQEVNWLRVVINEVKRDHILTVKDASGIESKAHAVKDMHVYCNMIKDATLHDCMYNV